MKKLALLLLVAAGTVSAATFNLFTPASGVLKGNPSTYVTTSATSTDVKSLWSGTCDSTSYLRGDGTCATPPGTGGGTVNSVALSAPSVFGISGSPVTTTGTLALSFASGQTANSFLATPDGTTGALSLRTILNGDLPTVNVAHGGTGVATITGPLKGNGTSAFSAATSADIYGLWSGTCSSGTFLRGDGACAAGSGGTVTSVALTVPSGFSVTGSPVTSSGTLAISGTLNPAAGGTGVATLTGIAKGNGTSAFTTATSGDVIATWGGTCSASTYLRGDGSCQTPATGGTSANPSATIGLTAVNGAASTYMRSDGAPALSQAIAPTWSGKHTFAGSGASFDVSNGSGSAQFTLSPTGGDQWNPIAGVLATSDFGLRNATRGTVPFSISGGATGGNVTIAAPGAGDALTISTLANTKAIWANGALTGTQAYSYWIGPALTSGNSGGIVFSNNNGSPVLSLETYANGAKINIGSNGVSFNGSYGTAGQVLTSGGSSAAPSWTTVPKMVGADCSSTSSGSCTQNFSFGGATITFSSRSTGTANITLGGFTATPTCNATSRRGASVTTVMEIPTVNSTAVVVTSRDSNSYALNDQEFEITCIGN